MKNGRVTRSKSDSKRQSSKIMGEYAKIGKITVKIGGSSCMHWLRADQYHLVKPYSEDLTEFCRFRFPFPHEDHIKPGFDWDEKKCFKWDYSLPIPGLRTPDGVEHSKFTKKGQRHYKDKGPVHIIGQRLVEGRLVLICMCGACGELYRLCTLDEAQPVIKALHALAKKDKKQAVFYNEVARRVVAGYCDPNPWSKSTPIIQKAAAAPQRADVVLVA